jgi:hypothetical protein
MDVRTLRRREADGKLSGKEAAALAAVARCDVGWLLTSHGRPPGQAKTALAGRQDKLTVIREREGRDSYSGVRGGEDTRSEPSESLSPQQIADEVSEVLAPLILQLAEKGPLVAARWLLTAAAEANDQSVSDVRSLIDLARDFLWRAERVG